MTSVPGLIPVAVPWLDGSELEYIKRALAAGQVSGGAMLTQFEQEFAQWLGVRFAVACSSGTTALHLACLAAGVKPGDEVIVPGLAFVAVSNAVRYCGATPVAVDVYAEDLTLDTEAVRMAISPATRAVIAVHSYGAVCTLPVLQRLCSEYGLALIEDAAEAIGSRNRDGYVGSIGRCGVFSFYGNKTITTGEGGMLTTNDAVIAHSARLLRGQGQTPGAPYQHGVVGYNYRMTELQAALGLSQLHRIADHLAERRRIRRLYVNGMKLFGLPELGVRLQMTRWGTDAVWWMTVVTTPRPASDVRSLLAAVGIETRPVFLPADKLPLQPTRLAPGGLFRAQHAHEYGIVLPTWAKMGRKRINYICEALRQALV